MYRSWTDYSKLCPLRKGREKRQSHVCVSESYCLLVSNPIPGTGREGRHCSCRGLTGTSHSNSVKGPAVKLLACGQCYTDVF